MSNVGGVWGPFDGGKSSLRLLLVSTDSQLYLRLCELLQHPSLSEHSLLLCRTVADALRYVRDSKADLLLVDEKSVRAQPASYSDQLQQMRIATPVIMLGDDMAMDLELPERLVVDLLPLDGLTSALLARSIYFTLELNASRQQQQLQAQYDPLTGLPNRMLFRDLLSRAIARSDRDGSSFVMLLLDLDGFSKVNDGYGQKAGDRLIREVTSRVQSIMRSTDTLARTDGDEFAIIMEYMSSSSRVLRSVKSIVDVVALPINIDGKLISIHSSVGISNYPEGGVNPELLNRNAKLAMKKAKKQKGSSYHFYTEELNNEAIGQLHLEAELKRAIKLNELQVYYQPRIDVKTERVVAVEALVRWQHPARGLLSPAEFIPFAEECGLIIPIGYWVLNQACRDMGVLTVAGYSDFHVSVNLSLNQFNDDNLQKTITDIINESSADVSRLEFELTETSVMQDPERTTEIMQALSKRGIQFSLDDFGTGHSSFARLQQLPIQTLKIDRSFIMNLQDSSDNQVIVRAMISLAHNLNLAVVAEGVDRVEQANFLQAENCDQFQGFLYSKPIPLQALLELLQRSTRIERLPKLLGAG